MQSEVNRNFISCDDELLRKSKEIEKRYGIKVCSPIEFIRLEGRENGDKGRGCENYGEGTEGY